MEDRLPGLDSPTGTTVVAPVPVLGAVASPTPTPVYAINCGGPAVDGWAADSHYSAGSISWGVAAGDDPLGNRQRFVRSGELTYTLPLPTAGGAYRLALLWKELYYDTPGARRMRVTVAVDGRPPVTVVKELDVVARTDGARRMLTVVYPPPYAAPLAANTVVTVSVSGVRGDLAFLSALRLDPAAAAWSTAINCGGPAVSAAAATDGTAYVADTGYSAGSRAWSRTRRPLLPQHAALRYAPPALVGGLVYTLPVPRAALYRVTLTWVELYVTAAGRRRMDVYIGADAAAAAAAAAGVGRGGPALRRVAAGVDVYRRAGDAADRPVAATFVVAATTSVTAAAAAVVERNRRLF